jgi:hypothetical protein
MKFFFSFQLWCSVWLGVWTVGRLRMYRVCITPPLTHSLKCILGSPQSQLALGIWWSPASEATSRLWQRATLSFVKLWRMGRWSYCTQLVPNSEFNLNILMHWDHDNKQYITQSPCLPLIFLVSLLSDGESESSNSHLSYTWLQNDQQLSSSFLHTLL